MKKILVLVLAMAMLAMSTAVFASAKEETADVKAKYIPGERIDKFDVNVTWGDMQFNYVAADEVWNAQSHAWEPTTEPAWEVAEGKTNTIKVTNNSSVAVSVAFTSKATDATVTAWGAFSAASFTLTSAQEANNEKTVTFMPTGELAATVTDYAKIGEITVHID